MKYELIVTSCRTLHELIGDIGREHVAQSSVIISVRRGPGGVPYFYLLKNRISGRRGCIGEDTYEELTGVRQTAAEVWVELSGDSQ